MASSFLYILQLGTVFKRDERRALRVRRVATIETERGSVFAHHAVDRVRVHMPTFGILLAVMFQRPKHRPVAVGAVTGGVKVGAPLPCARRWHRRLLVRAARAERIHARLHRDRSDRVSSLISGLLFFFCARPRVVCPARDKPDYHVDVFGCSDPWLLDGASAHLGVGVGGEVDTGTHIAG